VELASAEKIGHGLPVQGEGNKELQYSYADWKMENTLTLYYFEGGCKHNFCEIRRQNLAIAKHLFPASR
jgi:hypothetical protein